MRSSSRERKAHQRFEPDYVSEQAIRAAIAMGKATLATVSEVSADEARAALREQQAQKAVQAAEAAAAAEAAVEAEAATPRPLPFSMPPRARQEQSLLRLTCSEGDTATTATHPSPSVATGTPRVRKRQSAFEAQDDLELRGILDTTNKIKVISEFSGVGALEHGMTAGFAEAGLSFDLIEASELDDTTEGRHASAVLRKRFPNCTVYNPAARISNPYSSEARVLNVTTQCTEHSGLNPNREPWKTEALLEPVLKRLAKAPQIEVVVFENVPNVRLLHASNPFIPRTRATCTITHCLGLLLVVCTSA